MGILLPRFTLLLLGVGMKYLRDYDASQDAVQQIFLKALTQLPGEPVQNIKGWLYILMRNHCLQQLRDSKAALPAEALEHVAAEPDELDALHWKEHSLEQLKEAVDQLPEPQATAIELFYLKEQSYQQIMDSTGWSFMQVKSYIQNGRRNLKIKLSPILGKPQS